MGKDFSKVLLGSSVTGQSDLDIDALDTAGFIVLNQDRE